MRDKTLGKHKSVLNVICRSLVTLALALTASMASAEMTGRVLVTDSSPEDQTTPKERFVPCPDDTKPIGGGALITGQWKQVALKGSIPYAYPYPDGTTRLGWLATANSSVADSSWALQVTVICATSD